MNKACSDLHDIHSSGHAFRQFASIIQAAAQKGLKPLPLQIRAASRGPPPVIISATFYFFLGKKQNVEVLRRS